MYSKSCLNSPAYLLFLSISSRIDMGLNLDSFICHCNGPFSLLKLLLDCVYFPLKGLRG